MSLYLIHAPLTFWIRYLLYGAPNWKMGRKIRNEWQFPAWIVPIHIIISVLLGFLLTFLIEEPARVWLKKCKENYQKKKNNEIQASDTNPDNKPTLVKTDATLSDSEEFSKEELPLLNKPQSD